MKKYNATYNMFMNFVECNFELLVYELLWNVYGALVALLLVSCKMLLRTVFCGYCFPIIKLLCH